MNLSQNTSLLKQIESNTDSISNLDTTTTNSQTILSGMNLELIDIKNNLGDIEADTIKLDNLALIDTELETINNKLVDIGITLSKNDNKIIFNAYLTDGSNDYFALGDYSSSEFDFSWTNTFDKPVHITRYDFLYNASNNPVSTELYHSPSFTSKIGAMNEAGDDYDSNYIIQKQNREFPHINGLKRTHFSDTIWTWQYQFNRMDISIEIGVSRKFGHHIAGDFTNGEGYNSSMMGIIYGYYYDD